MVRGPGFLSLALPLLSMSVNGLELDVSKPDSIKSTAKTLASGIAALYDENLKAFGPPGLFKDYYWWEAGVVFNSLISYSYLTGDKSWDNKVADALQWQVGDMGAFMPPNQTKTLGNDDQSSWGLAAMTAAEVGFQSPKNSSWLTYAKNVFETQTSRWDNTACGGGLKWQIFSFNSGYTYRNTWTNGNYFLLAARLAKFTGNITYAQHADRSFRWATQVGLIGKEFQVYDGTDDKNGCRDINKIRFSLPFAAYTEGAALMYNITGAQNWTDTVQGFVKSSSVFLESNSFSVMVESACENSGKCNTDQRAMKSNFARGMARAALAAPIVKDSINNILSTSAKAAAKACTSENSDVKCPLQWTSGNTGSTATAKKGNLGEVLNALEVIQSLLYPSAKALLTNNSASTGSPTQNEGASGSSGAKPAQSTSSASVLHVTSTASVILTIFVALTV